MNTLKMLSDYSFVSFVVLAVCTVCCGLSNLITKFGESNIESIVDINRYDRSSTKPVKIAFRGFLAVVLFVLKLLSIKEFSIFWALISTLSVVSQIVK